MATLPARQPMPQELSGLRPAGSYTFDELYRLAQVCHASGLFEDVKDAAQAMIKIVKGQEMGFPPTTAMAAFDVIQKKVFIKPWAIAAKINSCGYGAYRIVEHTSQRCTIIFSKRYAGKGWEDLAPVTYSIEEAQQLGLTNRSPQWKSAPQNMLYHRCMGRGGSMHFPELLAGMEMPPDREPVSHERHVKNVQDLFGDDAIDVTPPAPAPQPSSLWMDTLEAHWQKMAEPLRSQCFAVIDGRHQVSDGEGHALAEQVLAALDFLPPQEEAGQ